MKKKYKLLITLILFVCICGILIFMFGNTIKEKQIEESCEQTKLECIESIKEILNENNVKTYNVKGVITKNEVRKDLYNLSISIKSQEFDSIKYEDLYQLLVKIEDEIQNKDYITDEYLNIFTKFTSSIFIFDVNKIDNNNGLMRVNDFIVYYKTAHSNVDSQSIEGSWKVIEEGNILNYSNEFRFDGNSFSFFSDNDFGCVDNIDTYRSGRWYLNKDLITLHFDKSTEKVIANVIVDSSKMYFFETNGYYMVLEKIGNTF